MPDAGEMSDTGEISDTGEMPDAGSDTGIPGDSIAPHIEEFNCDANDAMNGQYSVMCIFDGSDNATARNQLQYSHMLVDYDGDWSGDTLIMYKECVPANQDYVFKVRLRDVTDQPMTSIVTRRAVADCLSSGATNSRGAIHQS